MLKKGQVASNKSQLKKVIQKSLDSGWTVEETKDFMLTAGHTEKEVDDILFDFSHPKKEVIKQLDESRKKPVAKSKLSNIVASTITVLQIKIPKIKLSKNQSITTAVILVLICALLFISTSTQTPDSPAEPINTTKNKTTVPVIQPPPIVEPPIIEKPVVKEPLEFSCDNLVELTYLQSTLGDHALNLKNNIDTEKTHSCEYDNSWGNGNWVALSVDLDCNLPQSAFIFSQKNYEVTELKELGQKALYIDDPTGRIVFIDGFSGCFISVDVNTVTATGLKNKHTDSDLELEIAKKIQENILSIEL